MDTNYLKIFVEVVKQGSFASAARQLDLDPSVATRAIAALEKELGSRLMERTSRHLVLTDTGRFYYERACRLVQDLQQGSRSDRRIPRCRAGYRIGNVWTCGCPSFARGPAQNTPGT
jgi:DNA-binding transcriptional LysR family regulator